MSQNHFGDIMSSRRTEALVNGQFSPLERIVLTANGNLQRILSAFFNSKVSVEIVKNEERAADKMVFDRVVELICLERVCCVAESVVSIYNSSIADLVNSKQIGIGQLFRYLNVLPEFTLLSVSRLETHFKRRYTLETDGMMCDITETFPNSLFDGFNYSNQEFNMDCISKASTYSAPN